MWDLTVMSEIVLETAAAEFRAKCYALLIPPGVDLEDIPEAGSGDEPW
jgi:hypothetical protein